MTPRRALLALHDPSINRAIERYCRFSGYVTESAGSVSELEERLNPAKPQKYRVVIMDANLGKPGSLDFSPARRIWSIVHERHRNEELYFCAVSGREEVVEQLRPEGIPVFLKGSYDLADLLPAK